MAISSPLMIENSPIDLCKAECPSSPSSILKRKHRVIVQEGSEESRFPSAQPTHPLLPVLFKLKLKQFLIEIQLCIASSDQTDDDNGTTSTSDGIPPHIAQLLFAKVDLMTEQMVALVLKGFESETRCMKYLYLIRNRVVLLQKRIQAENNNHHTSFSENSFWTFQPEEHWKQATERIGVWMSENPDSDVFAASQQSTHKEVAMLIDAIVDEQNRGIHYWNENQITTALPLLVSADRTLQHVSLKIQQLNIENALSNYFNSSSISSSPRKKSKSVRFSNVQVVIGVADENIDRVPIEPTRPSKIESLLIRSARVFPGLAVE